MTTYIVYHMTNMKLFRNASFGIFQREEEGNKTKLTVCLHKGYKPVAQVNAEDLNQVFRDTNHIDSAWYLNPSVKVIDDMTQGDDGRLLLRSTNVGDLIYDPISEEAWIVAGCGFDEINLRP